MDECVAVVAAVAAITAAVTESCLSESIRCE